MEKQLSFNRVEILKLSQHILTYFMITLKDAPQLPLIVELDATMKTRCLNAPLKMKGKEVKKWAIEKAIEILKKRKDEQSLQIMYITKKGNKELELRSKSDDVADTVVMIEAFCRIMGWPTTENIYDE
jgi:hypothetical protein